MMKNYEFPESQHNFDVKLRDVRRVDRLIRLIKSTVDPAIGLPLTDHVEESMLREAIHELEVKNALRPHLEEVFAFRRTRGSYYPPGYDLRTLEFAIDKQMHQNFPDYYPHFCNVPGTWRHFNMLGTLDYDELFIDMQESLRSNITQGYEIFKFLSHLYENRWDHPPTVVDTGTGLGLGLMKWKLHDDYPFEPIKVLEAPRWSDTIHSGLPPDEEAQKLVDYLIGQKPTIGKAVGYDILPINPNNENLIDLVFSSTFPMSRSIEDTEGVNEFRSMTKLLQSVNTTLKQMQEKDLGRKEEFEDIKESLLGFRSIDRNNIDATDSESLAQLAMFLPGGKADIFTFSGLILQLPRKKLDNFFGNFLPYCNEGALFFVNEWANLNPDMPSGLEIIREDWWHRRAEFKTFIIDPFNLDQPPIEFCRFIDRQCKQMYLTPAGRQMIAEKIY